MRLQSVLSHKFIKSPGLLKVFSKYLHQASQICRSRYSSRSRIIQSSRRIEDYGVGQNIIGPPSPIITQKFSYQFRRCVDILISSQYSKIRFKHLLPSTLLIRREFSSQSHSTSRHSAKSKNIIQPFLKTMKLSTPEFGSIFTDELKSLFEMFEKHGFEIRIAGGAVRDLLDGKVPNDIDFATEATPSEMKEMFSSEGIRMINANGEAHGTITARINDKENFEVTTLRIDVVTDGRRAQVEFTKDWMLDANRRDLTINSMFLGIDGTIYDYFNGVKDLKEKRVRFVGHPEERIQEDYLRILRYFRFFGRVAESPNSHEDVTTQAIKENTEGLNKVSGERIWIEMKKIISGRMAASLIEKMLSLGLGPSTGLPDVSNFEELTTVCDYTEGKPHHHMTRLSAIMKNQDDVYKLHQRCKLSNDELSMALFIVNHRGDKMGEDLIQYCTDLHTDSAGKEAKVMSKIVELMKYRGHADVAEKFPNVQLPQFPVTGSDLVACDVPRGPKFSCTLNELRRIWKESSYSLRKEELCLRIPDVLENLPQDMKKMKKK